MTMLAPSLQGFFTTYAVSQRALSPNTVAAYRDTWRLFIKHLCGANRVAASEISLEMITPQSVNEFLGQLETGRGNSPATRNARLSAIRAVVARAIPDNPGAADNLGRVLAIPARRTAKATVTFLTPEEADALLGAPDTTTWTGRRDRALLALAAQTGLRASEITSLTIGDAHLGRPAHVNCIGKGRKHRMTPLTANTVKVMTAYLAERRRRPGQALFPGPSGGPLSRDALERRIAIHLASAASIQPSLSGKHATMHTLRHTAAMRLLEAGTDPAVIALWLGHESIATTSIYLHADMAAKQSAIDKTRPATVQPGRYRPQTDVLAWLDTL
ncbi:MAG: site-specific integrase [Bifidobacteriaceae bacterium]|jgi:site-specific recombinase XerD|nr:site-specific integrase [Bifidobacteriaceae bacterium]